MYCNSERGAKIIIENWMRIRPWDRLLIVTSYQYMMEASLLRKYALRRKASVDMMIHERAGAQVGVFFDENETIFDGYTAIIGATDYSLITTKATKRAVKRGSRFLSLPLSVNNSKSMLSYDFITMDTKKAKMMANLIMKYIRNSSVLRITTHNGTDMKVYKRGRKPGFFNGVPKDGNGLSSASFEIYVPIEETKTEGVMVVDGSLGYIGKPQEPVRIVFSKGKIFEIEQNASGIKLKEHIETYNDSNMYVSSEFGMGLNSYSRCEGNCYIEDESAYGTFHIGFGRNIALGGVHEARGHFDLVSLNPDVYADNMKIMDRGRIIVPEFHIY
jgi:leucyl aminopeptidase (aminopeptidase T)